MLGRASRNVQLSVFTGLIIIINIILSSASNDQNKHSVDNNYNIINILFFRCRGFFFLSAESVRRDTSVPNNNNSTIIEILQCSFND